MSADTTINLKKENGKAITVNTYGADVAITLWRKNKAPLTSVVLNRMEAQRLRELLEAACRIAQEESL